MDPGTSSNVLFRTTCKPARANHENSCPRLQIGEVCSGAFSPTLGQNIAMGYVPRKYAKNGTEFKVDVRGKMNTATVTKMPFVDTTYFKG